MSSINTNSGALLALRNLGAANNSVDRSLQQTATGVKPTPAVDASSLAVGDSLESDLKAFDAVQQGLSAATGINSAAIAGATTVSDLLGGLREKAIAASNPANTPEQQAALAADFQSHLGRITDAISNANYNGRNLISSGSQSVSLTTSVSGGQQTLANAAAIGGIPSALGGGVATPAAAASMLTAIDAAAVVVGESLATLGANQKAVEFQSTFSKTLASAVTEGLGNLVDTNLAAEAAKLQALQVKQSLSGGTLNIANQRPQTLLSLFNT
jgi:flagellin